MQLIQVVSVKAGRLILKSSLVSDLTLLSKHKDGLLTTHDNIIHACILIGLHYDMHGCFTQVGYPIWSHRELLILGLGIFLLVDIILLQGMQCLIGVALQF